MKSAQLALPGLLGVGDDEWVFSEDVEGEDSIVSFQHETVLRGEVAEAVLAGLVDATATSEFPRIVDATLGGGGHTEAILAAHPTVRVYGIDRDATARAAASERLAPFGERFIPIAAPFSRLAEVLGELGVSYIDGICADLGVSSPQLDDARYGMSFRREGPIDMRMDTTSGETALEMIERLGDDELANVLFHYGDERRSRRIARSVKKASAEGELRTTLDLRRAIVRAVGPVRVGGVDPATRTFQALRIAVNRELDELDALLAAIPQVLRPGGRAAIISFHSLEDRKIKQAFSLRESFEGVSRKPIIPSDDEQALNVRARSAKLRVAARVGAEDEAEVVAKVETGHDRYLARRGGKKLTRTTVTEAGDE